MIAIPHAYRKRTYTPGAFVAALGDLVSHRHDLWAARGHARVSKAFAERVMLAVTQVNDCRYCRFVHTNQALRSGVRATELRDLLAGRLEAAPAGEAAALLFAQHYAETAGRVDPAARRRLDEVYGEQTARDILVHIRMISLGNMLGNTFDGLLNRLRGRPMEGPFWQEAAVLLLAVLLVPPLVVAGLAWGLLRLAHT